MTYVCDLCRAKYKTEAECRACEEQMTRGDLGLAVGDVLTFNSFEFGWHDGDSAWVRFIEPRRNVGAGYARLLVYIITAVTRDEHRHIYHVETLAMEKGRGGYTSMHHFTRFKKFSAAEAIPFREQAEKAGLMGKTFPGHPVG